MFLFEIRFVFNSNNIKLIIKILTFFIAKFKFFLKKIIVTSKFL